MANVKMTRKDDVLTITCSLSAKALKEAVLSKKGKSRIIAGTGGFTEVDGPGGYKLSLNLIAPLEKE